MVRVGDSTVGTRVSSSDTGKPGAEPMPHPHLKFTVRRLMIAVAFVGIMLAGIKIEMRRTYCLERARDCRLGKTLLGQCDGGMSEERVAQRIDWLERSEDYFSRAAIRPWLPSGPEPPEPPPLPAAE